MYINNLFLTEYNAFERWLRLKRYSNTNTYKNYLGIVRTFLNSLDCHLLDVTQQGVEEYILRCKSQSSMRQMHGCLGNFFKYILQKDIVQHIPFPTREEKLPDVYSLSEVQKLINACNNTKHKLLILLQYDTGLRVSELTGIRLQHIDFDRGMIKIEAAKGKKDRYAPISKTTMQLIQKYCTEWQPKNHLFESPTGEKYSTRSIQAVNIAAKEKAGIKKNGCTHILRHSFATHLLEQGSDINIIGNRLGHSPRSKATFVYCRITQPILQHQTTLGSQLQIQ